MKNVLITGASGGIGDAICEILAKDHKIFIVGRDLDKLNLVKAKYNNIENSFICDLSSNESIDNFLMQINKQNISIDILINNAGITNDSLFIRMDLQKWQNVINTNLTSTFLLSNFFSKKMIKKRWGRIINITSVVGHTGNIGQSNYTASKSGIIGMSKSIAAELAKRNITVNCISPGFIETKMTNELNEEHKTNILSNIPMGFIGKPEDVAHCVAFLASEQARYITGETIHVNGGLAML